MQGTVRESSVGSTTYDLKHMAAENDEAVLIYEPARRMAMPGAGSCQPSVDEQASAFIKDFLESRVYGISTVSNNMAGCSWQHLICRKINPRPSREELQHVEKFKKALGDHAAALVEHANRITNDPPARNRVALSLKRFGKGRKISDHRRTHQELLKYAVALLGSAVAEGFVDAMETSFNQNLTSYHLAI